METLATVRTLIRCLSCVFPPVILEVRAHLECLPTDITHILAHILMNYTHMCFKVTGRAESLPTSGTHITPSLWSIVHASPVCDHVCKGMEDHLTLWTRMLHLFSVYCICVYPHGPGVREWFATDLTYHLILADFEMDPFHMLPEVTGADKPLVADVTQEPSSLLSLVHTTVVVLHVALLVEHFLANWTLKYLST